MKDNASENWKSPMWDREKPAKFWDPGRKLLLSIRHYQTIKGNGLLSKLIRKTVVFRYRFWSAISGAEIDLDCKIGGGLLIPHPNGIVIHPSAEIGVNCLIFQQVTLTQDVKLGYRVDIGAGARLLGPIQVGNNVQIGANAVVTRDVLSGQTMVGVPARNIA